MYKYVVLGFIFKSGWWAFIGMWAFIKINTVSDCSEHLPQDMLLILVVRYFIVFALKCIP